MASWDGYIDGPKWIDEYGKSMWYRFYYIVAWEGSTTVSYRVYWDLTVQGSTTQHVAGKGTLTVNGSTYSFDKSQGGWPNYPKVGDRLLSGEFDKSFGLQLVPHFTVELTAGIFAYNSNNAGIGATNIITGYLFTYKSNPPEPGLDEWTFYDVLVPNNAMALKSYMFPQGYSRWVGTGRWKIWFSNTDIRTYSAGDTISLYQNATAYYLWDPIIFQGYRNFSPDAEIQRIQVNNQKQVTVPWPYQDGTEKGFYLYSEKISSRWSVCYGWTKYGTSDRVNIGSNITLSAPTRYQAMWSTVFVSYNTNGGSIPELYRSPDYPDGNSKAVILPPCSKVAYYFNGWKENNHGWDADVGRGGESYIPRLLRPTTNQAASSLYASLNKDEHMGSTELIATWTKLRVQLCRGVDGPNGETVSTPLAELPVDDSGHIVLPSASDLIGKLPLEPNTFRWVKFDHWSSSPSEDILVGNAGDTYAPSDKNPVAELYGVWKRIEASYDLSIPDATTSLVDANRFPSTSSDPDLSKKVVMPSASSHEFTFLGWYLPDDPNTLYAPGTYVAISRDTTFYAAWEATKTAYTYDAVNHEWGEDPQDPSDPRKPDVRLYRYNSTNRQWEILNNAHKYNTSSNIWEDIFNR